MFSLVLFFVFFCAVLVYVYADRKRSDRLESYKYMPLQEDDQDQGNETDHKVRKP
jgi:cbb3-type cytochrome oxidase subunit 3